MKTIKITHWNEVPTKYTGIIEYASGNKYWLLDGKQHRVDGPAIEYVNGDKSWYLHGRKHRVDGPAIEYADGDKCWYLDGHRYTEEEHKKEMAIRNSTLGKLILGGNKFDLEEK